MFDWQSPVDNSLSSFSDIRHLNCRLATKQLHISNCSKHTWPPPWTCITLFSQTARNQQTTQSITGRTACHMQILLPLCAVWVCRALLTAPDMRLYITIYVMFSSMRRISGRLWPALGVSALWGCPWHLGPSQWPRRETWSFLLRSPGRRTNTSAAHQTEKPNIDDGSQLFRARMTKALELALIYLSSSLLFRCFFWMQI